MTSGSDPIVPDDKDWTWVLREPCPECGFVAADVDPADVGPGIDAQVATWQAVVRRDAAAVRPRPERWSDLEYACHVRDVFTVFAGRIEQMLDEPEGSEGARFANWDQDAAALEGDYAHADPTLVEDQLAREGERLAAALARVEGADWQRRGLRSNGSEFTTATLTQYLVHDLEHHRVDVGA
ncbi:DinB family protein [Aeromicrobium sp. Leaf350]|uniref:DinB family protein n=1 Tax=Aeromicrobium sp. Leaf350 TaxID=2876565 RepID=UPI001E52FF06|nr:DinB family protein [Aeromicrobium sp. Leaf350]